MQLEGGVDLQSYGEPATALEELLVPFLAVRHFVADRPRSVSADGLLIAVFDNRSQFDAAEAGPIVFSGKFNCVSVAYHTWVARDFTGRVVGDPKGPDRALAFRGDLEAFLASLPTPRIKVTETTPKSKRMCGRAL